MWWDDMGWDKIFKKTGLKICATFLLGEKPYQKPHQCNFCNKEFKRYSTYFVHMRRFHCDDDKKPHHCSECQKGFATKGDLEHHVLSHTGEWPYVCSYCTKSYKTSWYLSRHQRLHSGERPYSCKTCGKTFRWRRDLTYHYLNHNNERRHM